MSVAKPVIQNAPAPAPAPGPAPVTNDAEGFSEDDRLDQLMVGIGATARAAARALASSTTDARNAGLRAAAAALRSDNDTILAANVRDVDAAGSRGLTGAMIDRLVLTGDRVEAMAAGLEIIAELPDPVGSVLASWDRPNGLRISRVRVPLGVIGIIYESRPNVTADAGALCVKAGNAAILRGGSESFHSSRAIAAALARGFAAAGLPEGSVQLIPTTDRAAVGRMLTMSDVIDVIVPRGGRSLIERVAAESRIPVLKHLDGLCHVYIHGDADIDMARSVTVNAKMRRTGICGAAETLLVDRSGADRLLKPVLEALIAAGCEIRGDEAVCAAEPRAVPATEQDWATEYLDAIIAVRVVDGIDQAIAHIETYSSHHTECIITEDTAIADRFFQDVDSAILLHNASTQFADGGEFGMGAEIGISTGKLHARGPVGAEQLTSYKYIVRGTGQTRP